MQLVISSLPVFLLGLVVGVIAMAIFNKLRGGAANPATTKDAFDQYKLDVADHFTETGKKFQSMASQYQDLYEHLAVGAHTLLDNETATKMLTPPEQSKSSAGSSAGSSVKSSGKGNGKSETVAKAQVSASAGSAATKPTDNAAAANSSEGEGAKASNSSSAKTPEKKPTQNQGKKK